MPPTHLAALGSLRAIAGSISLLALCLGAGRSFAAPSAARLWDLEPPLRELAQSATISRAIPSADPQPMGTFHGGTAPNLSTKKLKVSLWGPPSAVTLSVNKTDVWDRRQFQESVLTVQQIRDTIQAGGVPSEHYRSWHAYDFPCPKPVGQIILRSPDLAEAEQPSAVTHCDTGVTHVEIHRGDAHADLTYLPMMTRNMIAVACDYEGLQHPVAVRLYRHRDTQVFGESITPYGGPDPRPLEGYDYAKDHGNGPMEPPASGTDGSVFWIEQRFPAEKTFPKGFSYVMAACIVGANAAIDTANGECGLGTPPQLNAQQQECLDGKKFFWVLLPTYKRICQAAGSAATATAQPTSEGRLQFTVLVSIVTSAEAVNPLVEAKKRLAKAAREGFAALLDENTAWYGELYDKREKGRIFKGDVEYARNRIPEVFASWACRHAGSCLPDPSKYEANTSYTFFEQDWAPWHGLPCYNELYFTPTHVMNRGDTLEYYYKLVPTWLEACKKNARDVFNLPGALIQHGYLPPIKPDKYFHTISTWEFCMEIPAQVLKVLWDRYDYSGDKQFLSKVAYPAMRETAIFYTHYASLGDDGYYHVIPAMSAEHWGWTKNFERNRDSTSALCMFKWLLNTTADASELLRRDAALRSRWREVADKLAPYPTYETPEGPVFTDVRDVDPIGAEYNFFAGFTPALLADEINLDSPDDQKELMLRTSRLVKGWLAGQVAPLLANAQGVEPEQLINSRSGRIHLFPAVPKETTIGFRDMQARGGFEVSAEYMRGRVTYVQLCARQKTQCEIMNPWPGQAAMVYDETARRPVPCKITGAPRECLAFPARKGHVYRLECSRV